MRSLAQVAALAALAAYTNAVCTNNGTFDCATDAVATAVQTAVATYAGDYEWTFLETTTGYQNRMFKFVADSTGNPVEDDMSNVIQSTKSPIIFVHTATKDCISWLTDTADDATDSIPKMLFDQGHDVYLACRRGTAYSRAHETFDLTTEDGLASYFNYNTGSVGTEDIEAFVDLALLDRPGCTKVQIVTHGLGAGEVLAGLAQAASTLPGKVSSVMNLAPCVIPTYVISGDSEDESASGHRLLSALTEKQMLSEPPRELHAIVEEDMPKRELGSSWYYSRESYWARTEKYCKWNPSNCLNYCDWYPAYCEEFCTRLPQYCVPEAVRLYYLRLAAFEAGGIQSLYGPDWATQVTTLCATVSTEKCTELTATVDAGLAEMSVTQLEHMFQMDFNNSFSMYSATFETDQTTTAMDVTGIATRNRSLYVKDDDVCDTAINQAILDTITGQQLRATYTNDLTHMTIYGANNNASLLAQLTAGISEGEVDDAGAAFCT